MFYNSFTNRNIINQAKAAVTAFMNIVYALSNTHMYYNDKTW